MGKKEVNDTLFKIDKTLNQPPDGSVSLGINAANSLFQLGSAKVCSDDSHDLEMRN